MNRETRKQRLKELKSDLDEGLITQSVYEARANRLYEEAGEVSSSDPFASITETGGEKDTVFLLKPDDEIGPEDQRFILKKILGRGGMGQVWLARDLQEENALGGGRECFKAVKVLPPELLNDKRSMAGLEREALRASKLNHAGVVNVFGLRKDPRRRMPFLIMEALEGHDLDEELTRAEATGQTGVGWDRMLDILSPVARTLDEIYDDYDGLIHRDLKPGNIFLSLNGKSKILDFGLAYQLRRSSQRLSEETGDTSSGTPDYMPPEAFAHGEPDRRQDVYALACIAYELLTGLPPYPREAVRDRPRELYPAQPSELRSEQWEALKKGLVYGKEQRPKTCTSLFNLLKQREPVSKQNTNSRKPESSLFILPEMVFIRGGSFLMGSPDDEPERYNDERQHSVSVGDFYLGKFAVTFDEYDRFAEATGWEMPNDCGWGRGRRPVICVSWHDASSYAEWLSKETGQSFRLPTEAEWEYAARAGTETPFYTGRCITTSQANYKGDYDYNYNCSGAKTGTYLEKTKEVGAYPANPWGLHDMAGNVWEWTGSVYDENYGGVEQRTSSKNDSSSSRVDRGGGWYDDPGGVRSAVRGRLEPGDYHSTLGFRLARTR